MVVLGHFWIFSQFCPFFLFWRFIHFRIDPNQKIRGAFISEPIRRPRAATSLWWKTRLFTWKSWTLLLGLVASEFRVGAFEITPRSLNSGSMQLQLQLNQQMGNSCQFGWQPFYKNLLQSWKWMEKCQQIEILETLWKEGLTPKYVLLFYCRLQNHVNWCMNQTLLQ